MDSPELIWNPFFNDESLFHFAGFEGLLGSLAGALGAVDLEVGIEASTPGALVGAGA